MRAQYDYKELREFLLPDHKWMYFTIRVLRTNGWIYFLMNTLPVLGTFLISDQPKTGWTIVGTTFLALASGFVALKAYRSQSPSGAQVDENNNERRRTEAPINRAP